MKAPGSRLRRRALYSGSSGQSIVEFALVLPLLMLVVLGVTELGYALLDSHIVTKLAREGSNLISRDTSIQDATTAMRSMMARPVNFDNGSSTVIFSVVRNVATIGAANFNKPILYQRYTYGSFSGQSALQTAGSGSFGPAPDYQAVNSDNNTSLQITNLPGNLTMNTGDMIYVTEIYTRHTLITPLNNFGITVPTTLYSIAYF